MLYNETLDVISSSDNRASSSCIVYIVLFSVFLIINISIVIYVYFFLYLKKRRKKRKFLHCFSSNIYMI